MLKLSYTLSQKNYAQSILFYLTQRLSFKFIAILLFGIIGISIYFKLFSLYQIPLFYIIFWILLWLTYTILVPHIIYKKAETIYKNTLFFHQPMHISIDKNQIHWSTISGEKIAQHLQIKYISVKNALIVYFSPYQIIPIPYDSISQNEWEQLLTILKSEDISLSTKYFQKFKKDNRDNI